LLASAHPVLSVSLIGYLPFFVAGILVCDLGISSDFWRKQRGLRWDGIGCLSMLVGYSIPNSLLVESAVLPLLFGFSIMAVFRGRLLAKIMAGPVVTAIGGMCYTIYLLHVPLIYFFGRLTRYAFVGHDVATNAVLQVLLLTVPILGMCCIFFLAIEKPCMNRHWPKELSQRVWWRGSNNMEAGHANV
jgi:peptidoglycan/LPS O-acetylase OafA/YrhL